MLRFLASTVITLVGNAFGLLAAAVLLPGFEINALGFIVSVGLFTLIEVLFEPFIISMALRYVPALRGGIALVTTLVGLFATSVLTDGIVLRDLQTWILAPLVVWLAVVIASLVLPLVMFKKTLGKAKENRAEKAADVANL